LTDRAQGWNCKLKTSQEHEQHNLYKKEHEQHMKRDRNKNRIVTAQKFKTQLLENDEK
jgi:hypothetical protein